MIHLPHHIHTVSHFQELVSTPFRGNINAMCWSRELSGDFSEIVRQVELSENMMELDWDLLMDLPLGEQGQLARHLLLNDLELLKAHGASPVLNLIRYYEQDEAYPFFPTDVYSFHVDRSPIPTDTFLCTYYGEASELLPNAQVRQKVLIPGIRAELRKLYEGPEEGFDSFLSEHFFDLHYLPEPGAEPLSLGLGQLWKLAVDHPESKVLPVFTAHPGRATGRPVSC